MDVEDAIRKRVEQRPSHQSHEASQTDQTDLMLAKHLDDGGIVGMTVRVIARIEMDGCDAGVTRSRQSRRVGAVGNNDGDRGVEATILDGIDDRLQIRAAAGYENRESAIHDCPV